ncbi:MAG TPA: cytochrome c [Polyangiaceae bacterium]
MARGLMEPRVMKNLAIVIGVPVLAFGVAVGCARPPQAPGGNADQVAQGAPLYVAHCAGCHGPTGAGGPHTPEVVGKNALPVEPRPWQKRTTEFYTAKDVYDFIRQHMPANNPGSLSDTQYADILAFDLKLNGYNLHHERVNEENASNFLLHPEQTRVTSGTIKK